MSKPTDEKTHIKSLRKLLRKHYDPADCIRNHGVLDAGHLVDSHVAHLADAIEPLIVAREDDVAVHWQRFCARRSSAKDEEIQRLRAVCEEWAEKYQSMRDAWLEATGQSPLEATDD